MNININEIVNNKLKEMEENKSIERLLEENVEKAVVKAIEGALDSYSLKREIEEKISNEVSTVIKDIGFTAYNGFIVEKVKQITEGVCRKDLADKIQTTFNEMLIVRRDEIKLSEICEKYREYMCENTDYEEKYELEHFWVEVEEAERPYNWLTFKFGKERPKYSRRSDENSIEFTVHRNSKNEEGEDYEKGWISTVYINDKKIDETLKLGHMSDIETLLVNIVYNKTPIIIDVECEDDIDNYFDVDC